MIPDLPDIIASVRDYLRALTPTLSGAQKYDAQVGAFLLDVAIREVEDGGAIDVRSRARLSAFLCSDDDADGLTAALAAAIRSGALDDRWNETLALVLAETVDQLRLVRPDHLAAEHAADPDRSPP